MDGEKPPSLSGTKLVTALGQSAASGAVKAIESASTGPLGLYGTAARVSNIAAVSLLAVLGITAFLWSRSDAQDDRVEYRQQVLRREQIEEERRREDRADRQRVEEMYRASLRDIARDNRDLVEELKASNDRMREVAAQMKLHADIMLRIEKLLQAKSSALAIP